MQILIQIGPLDDALALGPQNDNNIKPFLNYFIDSGDLKTDISSKNST